MYEREISGSGWSIVIKVGKKLKWKNWSRLMFYSGWLQVRGKCQEMGQSRLCVFLFGFLLVFFLLLDFFFIERYWTTKRRKKNYPMKFSYCHLGSKLWIGNMSIVSNSSWNPNSDRQININDLHSRNCLGYSSFKTITKFSKYFPHPVWIKRKGNITIRVFFCFLTQYTDASLHCSVYRVNLCQKI